MISTSTNVLGEISSVTSSVFFSVSPYFFFIIGIVVAFFVAEIMIDVANEKKLDKRIADTLERSRATRDL